MPAVKRKRILVVDDEVYIAHILEFSLGMEGYEVITATSGQEALAQADRENPDLIVLDILMPDMDGYEVCRRLRADERYAETPIILLTAKHGEEDRARGLQLGASAYITKPFRPVELIDRIRSLLGLLPKPGEKAVGY
jgi:two-component system alkaline phosphatase synthesis response regulator PhoP